MLYVSDLDSLKTEGKFNKFNDKLINSSFLTSFHDQKKSQKYKMKEH